MAIDILCEEKSGPAPNHCPGRTSSRPQTLLKKGTAQPLSTTTRGFHTGGTPEGIGDEAIHNPPPPSAPYSWKDCGAHQSIPSQRKGVRRGRYDLATLSGPWKHRERVPKASQGPSHGQVPTLILRSLGRCIRVGVRSRFHTAPSPLSHTVDTQP